MVGYVKTKMIIDLGYIRENMELFTLDSKNYTDDLEIIAVAEMGA